MYKENYMKNLNTKALCLVALVSASSMFAMEDKNNLASRDANRTAFDARVTRNQQRLALGETGMQLHNLYHNALPIIERQEANITRGIQDEAALAPALQNAAPRIAATQNMLNGVIEDLEALVIENSGAQTDEEAGAVLRAIFKGNQQK